MQPHIEHSTRRTEVWCGVENMHASAQLVVRKVSGYVRMQTRLSPTHSSTQQQR